LLGKASGNILLFGNERIPTYSLSLALPNGKSIDLGQAPAMDQQGMAGLTGKVDQHWWRLFGAVFIGGRYVEGRKRFRRRRPGQGRWGMSREGLPAIRIKRHNTHWAIVEYEAHDHRGRGGALSSAADQAVTAHGLCILVKEMR
jgi:hypothetical protein